ncbi:MAG: hypothetical protein HUN04_24585 [Desulfobacter sp.]|nr:MAG: hypothetical protein HUN04_24585 [Desulfobacter sp.]
MIQVDLPAAFAIGQTYALLSKNYLKTEDHLFTSKPLGILNFYLGCGFVPGGLYLISAYPAWEAMYKTAWLDTPFNNPPVAYFTVIFVILMILLGNMGYIFGHWCYKTGKDSLVPLTMGAGYVFTVLPFILDWGVWMKIGTYEEVVIKGGGYSFWEPPFFFGWAIIMAWLGLTTIGTGIWFKKRADTFRTRSIHIRSSS